MIHLHNGILHSRKKELLPFATAWMEQVSIMLSEISQEAKDLEVEPNEQKRQNSTRGMETRNRLRVTVGEGDNRGKKRNELVKEHVERTHGHGQQVGTDCGSREWRWWSREEQ